MTRPHPPRSPAANALAALALPLLAVAVLLGAASPPGVPAAPAPTPEPPSSRSAPPAAPVPELHAKVTTPRGTFRFVMHPKEAPLAVTNFCNLARQGFFDGLPVYMHTRVLRGSGRPFEDFQPGWTFRREFSPRLRFEQAGCVAMHRMGEGPTATTHPTVWFVTIKAQSRWTLDLPIFGTIVEGQSVVDRLEKDDAIERVEIEGDPQPLFDRYAKEVSKWNAALARSGWRRGGGAAPPPAPPAPTAPPPTAPASPAPPPTPAVPTAPAPTAPAPTAPAPTAPPPPAAP